jgi:hypothetical protein
MVTVSGNAISDRVLRIEIRVCKLQLQRELRFTMHLFACEGLVRYGQYSSHCDVGLMNPGFAGDDADANSASKFVVS